MTDALDQAPAATRGPSRARQAWFLLYLILGPREDGMGELLRTGEAAAVTAELCLDFEGAHGQKLAHAERLLRWVIKLYAGAVTGLDVAYDGPRRTLLALVRLQGGSIGPRDWQRIQFWVARSGGRVRRMPDVPPAEREALRRAIAHCDVRALKVDLPSAARTVTAIAIAAGLAGEERGYAEDRPTLAIDIGGPGWEAARWNDAEETLFLASPIVPPLGDPIPVVFSVGGLSRLTVEWPRVAYVCVLEDSGPGHPAGFALSLRTSPRELRRQIARWARAVPVRAA